MDQTPQFHPASFRDPEGRVFERDGKIFRTLSESAAHRMRLLERDGRLKRLIETGMVIPSFLVPSAEAGLDPKRFGDIAMQHERIALMTYPYECPIKLHHELHQD